ncbi:hypothetical protein [Streptomyces cavernae]|uniref:hypothetical protein n=1 Tax=Streptomyces cavernae TaxID=2259034 RepID=UPI000FEB9FB6|nr:hypothetical protein [Streptomyces cavernae]
MPYVVPALTRAEVDTVSRTNPKPDDCEQCRPGFPVPHWPSPVACRSTFHRDDNGIERLSGIHCTCDYCF